MRGFRSTALRMLREKDLIAHEEKLAFRDDTPTVPEVRKAFIECARNVFEELKQNVAQLDTVIQSITDKSLEDARQTADNVAGRGQIIELLLNDAKDTSTSRMERYDMEDTVYGIVIERLVRFGKGEIPDPLYDTDDYPTLQTNFPFEQVFDKLPERTINRFVRQSQKTAEAATAEAN